jgi:ubiquinone/menaquinone biosynthesis C-methylase UbiE
VIKQYDEARQGYPREVLDYLWSVINKNPAPHILDVGCGTGISTRALAEKGAAVTGCDRDRKMINQALVKPFPSITYAVAPAENLRPFESAYFDAVTTFGAFHWFANQNAIDEIKRVLMSKGVFFVANKNDVGDFKVGYRAMLTQFIEEKIPDIKNGYNPAKVLVEGSFNGVEKRAFETTELFTLTQAITYLQSVSIWNLVPRYRRETALKAIECYCKERLVNGFVERKLQIVTVVGRK